MKRYFSGLGIVVLIAIAVPSFGRAAARDEEPILSFDTDVPTLTSDVLNDHSTSALDIRAMPQDAPPQSEQALVPLPSALVSAAPCMLLILVTAAGRAKQARRLHLLH